MASLNVTVSGLARLLFPSYLIFNFCYFGEYTHGDGVPRVQFTLPIETEKVLHGSWQSYWGTLACTPHKRGCAVFPGKSRENPDRGGAWYPVRWPMTARVHSQVAHWTKKRNANAAWARWNLEQLKLQIKCINTSTAIVRLWIMANSIIHLERLFYFTGYQKKKRLVNLLDNSQLALRGKNLYVKTYNKAIKHNILLRINEACADEHWLVLFSSFGCFWVVRRRRYKLI